MDAIVTPPIILEDQKNTFATYRHDVIQIPLQTGIDQYNFTNVNQFTGKFVTAIGSFHNEDFPVWKKNNNIVNRALFERITITLRAGTADEIVKDLPLSQCNPYSNNGRHHQIANLQWNQSQSYIQIHGAQADIDRAAGNNEYVIIQVFYWDAVNYRDERRRQNNLAV